MNAKQKALELAKKSTNTTGKLYAKARKSAKEHEADPMARNARLKKWGLK